VCKGTGPSCIISGDEGKHISFLPHYLIMWTYISCVKCIQAMHLGEVISDLMGYS
jgi:hypothetical protein